MSIDKANIFKLDEKEYKLYAKEPFRDCYESTKKFAQGLKFEIETKDTPHTMLLEAQYGMGKTFFSTRFTNYLNNNGINTIYFSVWELEYLQDPFLAFAKIMMQYIKKNSVVEEIKDKNKTILNRFKTICKGISLSIPGIQLDCSMLYEAFEKETDEVADLKNIIKEFIQTLKKQKLVIIVDELDRCRPDYAMKTLECVKHFFDVEGLIVIFPCNEVALCNAVECLFNFKANETPNREKYFDKFFNDKKKIQPPAVEDYKIVIQEYVNNKSLKESINKKLIIEKDDMFNSLNVLIDSLASYSYSEKLTLRQLKDICKETVRICNNFYEPIRCSGLAMLITQKYNAAINAKDNHPFSANCNKKDIFFSMSHYVKKVEALERLHTYYRQNEYISFKNSISRKFNNINTYEDLENIIANEKIEINNLIQNHNLQNLNSYIPAQMQQILVYLQEQENLISAYKQKYGSDDNDVERGEKYTNIINSSHVLLEQFEKISTVNT